MAKGPTGLVLRHVWQLLGKPPADETSDGQLLTDFCGRRHPEAFASLVRRHGPMVFSVCRRVLRHEQDAEDAFQATFLVLARKAGSIRRRECLGPWLYEVAYHIALKARAHAARQRERERQAEAMHGADPKLHDARHDLRSVLDEELHRLPQRYRRLLILCDLQGRTHQEAARHLGLPPGSISRHLGRARELLRERLIHRGITLSTPLLVSLLAEEAAPAAAAALVPPTVQAAVWFVTGNAAAAGSLSAHAVALATGALHTMFLTKLKLALALLIATTLLAAAAGTLTHQLWAAKRPDPQAPEAPARATRQPGAPEALPTRLDRFGDSLPAGALARLGTTRFRLGAWVQSIVFTSDGKRLLAGGDLPRLFEADMGKEVRSFAVPEQPFSRQVALSPDGKILAAGGSYGTIYLLDATTGKERGRLAGHQQGITTIAFSPDGKLLASGSEINWPPRGQANPIRIWDVATGQEMRQFTGHTSTVYCLAFSPDGKTIASGADRYDPTLRLWDVATGAEIRKVANQGGDVWSVAFSPDGGMVATGSMDHVIRLWDPGTGRETRRLTGHRADVMAVAFSPDGKSLASGSFDGTLRLWDPATGKERWQRTGSAGGFMSVAFSPDGKALAAGCRDHTVRLWNVASGAEIRSTPGLSGPVDAVAFAPDGRTVLSLDGNGALRLWATETGKEVRTVGVHPGGVLCATLSADGRLAASGGQDKRTRLWDVATGQPVAELPGTDQVQALAFAPDGKTLAVGNRWAGPEISLWDLTTFQLLRQLPLPRTQHHGVVAVAFTPDGQTLATATFDGRLLFLDSKTGTECRPELKHGDHCQYIGFAPDGRTLVAGDMNGPIRLWELTTGKERFRAQGYPFALSPDGRLLASGNGSRVLVWDLARGDEAIRFDGHRGRIASLAFSPDGTQLASGSEDTTALIWDMRFLSRRQPALDDLSPQRLDQLWGRLADADAAVAFRAMGTLTLVPERAVPYLARQIHPVAPPDPRQLARLLGDLDSDQFEVRQRAARNLEQLGEAAEPSLRKALAGDLSPEVRRQVGQMLDSLRHGTADQRRLLRALEVLEHIGTPEARAVVARLARDSAGTRTGVSAAATLERLDRRSKVQGDIRQ